MDSAIKIIQAARNTLNAIDVRGVENMRRVLGCYDALGTALQELNRPEPEKEEADGDS